MKSVLPTNLRRFLIVILVATSLLIVDSIYLGSVTFIQWLTDEQLENQFFLAMFLLHLVLGFLLIVPIIVFMALHLRRAIQRPNRLAVRLGLSLMISVLVLIISGIALTRGLPLFEMKNPETREVFYWLHIVAPIAIVWLFVLHRLAGPKIRWRGGVAVIGVSALLAIVGMVFLQERPTSHEGEADFSPSLARTVSNQYIPAHQLMNDEYCADCHPDVHADWSVSAHRFASFNNPAYAFSVANTRSKVFARDGDVTAARFCAGCHDPVPLFSGEFDDPDYDFTNAISAHAGITCTTCHAIQSIGSTKGNADYLIAAPQHYPFATSQNPILRWTSALLIKGKPSFHKRSMLKPFHLEAEFCSTCHKVHLPEELNKYRWLRGQNHYDSFLLSGVSGHGVASFYYPDVAVTTCNECHMELVASNDFGAKPRLSEDELVIRDHQFPAANTALVSLADLPEESLAAHRKMLEGALRVDIFGIREGDELELAPTAPLGTIGPDIRAGTTYTIDVVLRTLTLGHHFTQGTSDSNEVWLDVKVLGKNGLIAASGGLDPVDGEVDPYAHFVNAYIVDRDGQRIALRNAEDIFTKLYDNQIAPGSAAVVHYRFTAPEHLDGTLRISAALKYRKFNTHYLQAIHGDDFTTNALPITLIGEDTVKFNVNSTEPANTPLSTRMDETEVAEWMRWNDYGIGWLNKPAKSGLRQAEYAFKKVIELGRAEGHLNLARTYIDEGRLTEAESNLQAALQKGAYPWSVAWFGGLIDLQNGRLDSAIEKFEGLRTTQFAEARDRGFDFSKDYRLLNTLARTYFERAKQARDGAEESRFLESSVEQYLATLAIDSENLTAHYGLAQVYSMLGDEESSEYHRTQHERYRVDDNARDRAIGIARRDDAAANQAADSIVIYALHAEDLVTGE